MNSKYAKPIVILVIMVALLLTVGAVIAANPAAEGGVDSPAGDAGYYIIQLSDPPLASYRGGIEGLAPTNREVLGTRKLDPKSPASLAYLEYLDGVHQQFINEVETVLGHTVDVNFTYTAAYNGMSMWLTEAEAAIVGGLDGVIYIQPEGVEYIDTDVGPQWIGADNIWDGTATGMAYMGEGVTIGVIDTGLVLDHPSFAEVGGDGYVHTNPLGSGNFLGLCDSDPGNYVCNDKTIGYYIFTGETHQDEDGHGSHTSSTAGGNVLTATVDITPSNPFLYEPVISGVAPHANIIMYDACTDGGGCPGSATLGSLNQTVLDGVVDVTNYSISGGTNPWFGANEQAFLAMVDAGIVSVASAGNAGPNPSTLGHLEPWNLTVGASTHNRLGSNAVIDMSGGDTTPPADIAGAGLGAAYGPADVVWAGDYGDPLCATPFPAGTWTNGEIVVCDRGGGIARVYKGYAVWRGGAGGHILANDLASGNSLTGDPHYLPSVHITYDDGVVLKTWLASGSGHMATIQGTVLDYSAANGDIMASFSSRGPNINFDALKPDVTAPGVDILAAYTDVIGPPAPAVGPTWMDDFNFVSGTSMSSPHTAGASALMVGLYPGWSPPQIKSAIMSAADPSMVLKEDGATPGDPFDYGAGSVRVDAAAQVGLVLDVTTMEFQDANPALGGEPNELNIASLQENDCTGGCVFTRTVYNHTDLDLDYMATVNLPAGGSGTVTPNSFNIPTQQSQTLVIEFNTQGMNENTWNFGTVELDETGGNVMDSHFPVALNPGEIEDFAAIEMAKTVGTDPAVCATTDSIQVDSGTTVVYCYEVTNTGDFTMTLHDLEDDHLGTILSGFPYDLTPGASVYLTVSTVITMDTMNTAVWTASIPGGPTASYTDTATVTLAPTDVTLSTFGSTGNLMVPAVILVTVAALLGIGMAVYHRREA